MTRKVSIEFAKKLLLRYTEYPPSKLSAAGINIFYDGNRIEGNEYVERTIVRLYGNLFIRLLRRRPTSTYYSRYEDQTIHWTMGGQNTQVTRDRLSAFGIIIRTKNGKVYWHKHDGTIQEIDTDEWYEQPVTQALLHLYKDCGVYLSSYDLEQIVPNIRRRRLCPAQ